jgi:hypothetical protein
MGVVTFTVAEWIYLAALTGADALVGTPDPFAGQPAREVEVLLFRARLGLAVRGVIDVAPDGAVQVAEWARELTGLCAAPEATLVLPGGSRSRYVHLAADRAVEQTTHREAGQIDFVELPGGTEPVMQQVAAGLLDAQAPAKMRHPAAPGVLLLLPPHGGEPVQLDVVGAIGRLAERYPFFFK